MQTLNKMKEKLEKETTEHKQVKQQVADLTAQLHELSRVSTGAAVFRPRLHLPRSPSSFSRQLLTVGIQPERPRLPQWFWDLLPLRPYRLGS